jgi:hypothetical protein
MGRATELGRFGRADLRERQHERRARLAGALGDRLSAEQVLHVLLRTECDRGLDVALPTLVSRTDATAGGRELEQRALRDVLSVMSGKR